MPCAVGCLVIGLSAEAPGANDNAFGVDYKYTDGTSKSTTTTATCS